MAILAATDFSENGGRALRAAAAEARRTGDSLALIHCIDTYAERWEYLRSQLDEGFEEQLRHAALERLEEAFSEAVDRHEQPELSDRIVRKGNAAEMIVETASEGDYDLVVVGATGGGPVSRLFLGSTAEEVVRASRIPVLTVPDDGGLESVDHVLAPVDLTDCSRRSLSIAAERARIYGAELTILHVSALPSGALTLLEWEPSGEEFDAHREFSSRQMEEFLDGVDLEGVEHETLLRFSAPDRDIVDVAGEREADLIVMGTHGRRGVERFFLGSTASKVLRHLPCPAITVRHPAGAETS